MSLIPEDLRARHDEIQAMMNDHDASTNEEEIFHLHERIGKLTADLEAARRRVKELEKKSGALITVLDVILPIVNNAIVLETIHGRPYTGPSLAKELAELRALLATPDSGRVNYVAEVHPDQEDGPSCRVCGAMMVHRRREWVCLSCGDSKPDLDISDDRFAQIENPALVES